LVPRTKLNTFDISDHLKYPKKEIEKNNFIVYLFPYLLKIKIPKAIITMLIAMIIPKLNKTLRSVRGAPLKMAVKASVT
jgi:hypothetical protein